MKHALGDRPNIYLKDGLTQKLKNRRVTVWRTTDGGRVIETKMLLGWKEIRHSKIWFSPEAGEIITDALLQMACEDDEAKQVSPVPVPVLPGPSGPPA